MDTARRPGFTLTELLLVLAILGILASVFGFTYGRVRAAEMEREVARFGGSVRVALGNVFLRDPSNTASEWLDTQPAASRTNAPSSLPTNVKSCDAVRLAAGRPTFANCALGLTRVADEDRLVVYTWGTAGTLYVNGEKP